MIVSREQRITSALLPFYSFEAVEKFLGLLFVQFEFGANGRSVAAIETVCRKLLFLHHADVAVSLVRGPAKTIDTLHALENRPNAFEPVSHLTAHRVKAHTPPPLKPRDLPI